MASFVTLGTEYEYVVISSQETAWVKENWPDMIFNGYINIRTEEQKIFFLLKYGPARRRDKSFFEKL